MSEEYYEDMLEDHAINKYLNMIANDYNGELAKIFEEKYINKDKEIERLNQDLGDMTKLFAKEKEKNRKAIEYIEKETEEINFENDKLIDLLDILKGE